MDGNMGFKSYIVAICYLGIHFKYYDSYSKKLKENSKWQLQRKCI